MGAELIHVMSNLGFGFCSLVLWYIGNEGFFHINVNVCLEWFIKQITNHLLGEHWIYFWIKQTEILHKKYPCFDVSKNISSFSKECNISFERALVFSWRKCFTSQKLLPVPNFFFLKRRLKKESPRYRMASLNIVLNEINWYVEKRAALQSLWQQRHICNSSYRVLQQQNGL